MPITINGTTGIAGVDGSAGTPAIQGTDTNTGIFFPAADTIAFGEGGSEMMRLNSAGYIGIGTSSPLTKLYVNGSAASSISALTDATTIAFDLSTGNNFSVTLGGNRTLGNPTNLVAGQSGVIFITQDGTGSRTLAYQSYWDFPSQATPSLTTTANAVDVLVYTVRSSTSIAAQLITNIG